MAIELSKTDRTVWRRLMMTEEGKTGMLWLHARIPEIKGKTSDEIIFQAGRAQGAKDILDAIQDLLADSTPKDINASND